MSTKGVLVLAAGLAGVAAAMAACGPSLARVAAYTPGLPPADPREEYSVMEVFVADPNGTGSRLHTWVLHDTRPGGGPR